MKIVDNLIKSPLIFLMIGFLIIEFIIFISLFFTFYYFLENNEEIITKTLVSQSDEIFNSISFLIKSQLNSVTQELLLFNQHINMKHLYTLSKSKYENDENICEIINSKSTITEDTFNLDDLNDKTRGDKIDILLNNEYLNKISLYTTNSQFDNFINDNINKKSICYALSFLKSLYAKNIISNQNMEKINYTLFINDIILFYPFKTINDDNLKSFPFFNSNTKCKFSKYNFECSSIINYKPKEEELTLTNSIINMNLKRTENNLYINTCINSNLKIYLKEEDNTDNNFFCISSNLSNILEEINYDSNYFTFNIIQYNEIKDSINVLFSSNDNIYKDISLNKDQDINNLFISDEYAQYQLNKNSEENIADLFHILYYEIEKYNLLNTKSRQDLIDEYQKNTNDILEIIKNKENINNDTKIINVTQSFVKYDYNNKGKIDHNYSVIDEDQFMYILRPIETDMVKIIKDKNIIDKNVKKILFYTLTIVKLIKPKRSLVYTIHNYICLKTFFYSLAFEVFICIIIYIFLFYIIRCILNPLKVFKANIEKLLDNNMQSKDDDHLIKQQELNENDLLNNQENQKAISIKDYMFNYFKLVSKVDFQYTNIEMKEIENIVSFLEKILLLRDKNTSYQAKADFYQSISSEISKKYELDLFRCQLLIAEYYIKDNLYTKAKQELENFQKRLEQCKAEFINKDKFHEKKNTFISTYNNSYINNYTDNISIKKDKFIRLEMITENFHYLMGLVNYFLFLELKKKKKEISNELNNTKSNLNKTVNNIILQHLNININNGFDVNSQTNKITAEMDYHLEKAIKHFKKSYKINNIFNINQIKNIIILVYLSKCYNELSSKSVEESNRFLKKAFLALSNFNQFIIELTDSNTLNIHKKNFNNNNNSNLPYKKFGYFESKLINNKKCYIDSRVMLIVNGSLMQIILYQIGKIALKMHKIKSAYFCFVKLIQISFFKNENIHFRAIKWLRFILSSQVNPNKKQLGLKLLQFQSKRKNSFIRFTNIEEEEETYIKKSSIEYMKDYLKNIIEIFEKNKYKRREKKLSKELLSTLEKKIDYNMLNQRASLRKRSRTNSKISFFNSKQNIGSLIESNNIDQSKNLPIIEEDNSQSSILNQNNNHSIYTNNDNQGKDEAESDLVPRSLYESITKSFIIKDLLIAQIIHSPLKIRDEEKIFKNIEKQYYRLSPKMKSNKCIIIIFSETFLENFSSLKSFNLLMHYCLNKFLDKKDKIGYIFYSTSSGIPDKFYELDKKEKALKKLDELFLGINAINKNKKHPKKKKYLTDSFDIAMDMFNNEQLNNDDDIEIKTDKYIFCFGTLNNLRYKSFEASFSQTNRINYMEISLYYFVFDSIENNKDKIIHYKKYFKKFIEAFLIFAENFKLIKLCFANICIEGKQKNIFSNKLECIKNII